VLHSVLLARDVEVAARRLRGAQWASLGAGLWHFPSRPPALVWRACGISTLASARKSLARRNKPQDRAQATNQ
jgi:hypothetical protein